MRLQGCDGSPKYCDPNGIVLQAGAAPEDRKQAREAYRKACGAAVREGCAARAELIRADQTSQ